jgi:hypothetical protein
MVEKRREEKRREEKRELFLILGLGQRPEKLDRGCWLPHFGRTRLWLSTNIYIAYSRIGPRD